MKQEHKEYILKQLTRRDRIYNQNLFKEMVGTILPFFIVSTQFELWYTTTEFNMNKHRGVFKPKKLADIHTALHENFNKWDSLIQEAASKCPPRISEELKQECRNMIRAEFIKCPIIDAFLLDDYFIPDEVDIDIVQAVHTLFGKHEMHLVLNTTMKTN